METLFAEDGHDSGSGIRIRRELRPSEHAENRFA
jgi:hypothetical protein